MEYIKVEENVVVELISAPKKPGKDWIKVNIEGGIHVGDDVRMFNSKWNVRPLKDLVKEGLVDLAVADESDPMYPEGTVLEKINDNKILPKTRYDFAKEGVIKLGLLEYLDDESEEIKSADSLEEMISLGKMTEEKAVEIKSEDEREMRDILLKELDAVVSNPLRWESLSESAKKTLMDYRVALLDVPQQKDFPWSIDWPEKPQELK